MGQVRGPVRTDDARRVNEGIRQGAEPEPNPMCKVQTRPYNCVYNCVQAGNTYIVTFLARAQQVNKDHNDPGANKRCSEGRYIQGRVNACFITILRSSYILDPEA